MEFTTVHLISLVVTVVAVLGFGARQARAVKTSDAFSLGGRTFGMTMVSGTLAGTTIGGAATIGTAQLAFSIGLSAWWFTLGCGIGLILLGLLYARPLRSTRLVTIAQFFGLNYGRPAGPLTCLISSTGILFSVVASAITGIQVLSLIFHLAPWQAACVLAALAAAYVFFGGMKGVGVAGLLKVGIVWITLFVAGWVAFASLRGTPDLGAAFPDYPWFRMLWGGGWRVLGNVCSLAVGIVCTQTYIQAIFSAMDSRDAALGAFTAAAITIPIGLPCVAVGMAMRVSHPEIAPVLALPLFLLESFPAWFGGLAIAGLLLSVVGSIAGLVLGITTTVYRDVVQELFKPNGNAKLVVLMNRLMVLGFAGLGIWIAARHLDSQVLEWNIMSMGLRGAGIFLPLTVAVFWPGRLNGTWALWSMVVSTVVAVAGQGLFHLGSFSLLAGIAASAALVLAGLTRPVKTVSHGFHA